MVYLGDFSGEGYLTTAAIGSNRKAAARAAEVLAAMGVKGGKKAVIVALASKDAFTRARGVEALGAYSGSKSGKALRKAFEDPEGVVRREAVNVGAASLRRRRLPGSHPGRSG